MSKLITDLVKNAQDAYALFKSAMDEAGIPFMVTCTYRSQEEQDALYEQGRTRAGKIVTWTHHSRHTARRAFDIAILKNGLPCWDTKVSVNDNEVPDYIEAGHIGEKCGLVWGGIWKTPDLPHFELPKEVIDG